MKEHGTLAVFVLRLILLVSFDAISYAAGLSGLPFWKFLSATALGMTLGIFAFVYLGSDPAALGPYLTLVVLALFAVVVYACHWQLGKRWAEKRANYSS